MSKAGNRGKRRTPGSTPPGADLYDSGGPQEAAAFIAETSGELSKIAQHHGLKTLKHLLDMARLEAEEWLRNKHRLS